MGIHADQPTSTPTFMAEMRARLFARIFTIDKVSVSFQGRPCLMSGRYVTTPLPRDIPDGAFMGGPEALSTTGAYSPFLGMPARRGRRRLLLLNTRP